MIRFTEDAIDPAALFADVNRPDCGAVVTFLGTVRDMTGDVATAALEYEAHTELADAILKKIESAVNLRWPVRAISIVHRLGVVRPTEASVGVAVACPHRADAFDACRFIIDRLKTEVPIWKRELSPDGSAHWVHPGVPS